MNGFARVLGRGFGLVFLYLAAFFGLPGFWLASWVAAGEVS